MAALSRVSVRAKPCSGAFRSKATQLSILPASSFTSWAALMAALHTCAQVYPVLNRQMHPLKSGGAD